MKHDKMIVAAGLVLAGVLGSATSAHAGVGFSFSFGYGRPPYGPYSYYGFYPAYPYARPPLTYYLYRPYVPSPFFGPYRGPAFRPYVYRSYAYRPQAAPRYRQSTYDPDRSYRGRWTLRAGQAIGARGYRPRVYVRH